MKPARARAGAGHEVVLQRWAGKHDPCDAALVDSALRLLRDEEQGIASREFGLVV